MKIIKLIQNIFLNLRNKNTKKKFTKKIPQSSSDLKKQLYDQLELLKKLAELYDKGGTVAAKAMATSIRVLVHDTKSSKSLLSQVSQKNIDFYDTVGSEKNAIGSDSKRIGSYHGLVGVGVANSTYIPYLDEPIPGHSKYVPFDEYWNRKIFIDGKNNVFTRKDVVLAIANQDGGAHVDPNLEEKYVELSRNNSMGLKSGINDNLKPLEGAELAAVRQIGHEIIRTLDSNYPKKKMQSGESFAIVGSPIFLTNKPPSIITEKIEKVGRNAPCPCGSGKKYKKCHGK